MKNDAGTAGGSCSLIALCSFIQLEQCAAATDTCVAIFILYAA